MAKLSKFILLSIFTVSIAGIFVVVTSYAPENTPKLAFILFYTLLTLTFSTVIGSFIHLLKKLIGSRYISFNIWTSIRQGFFMSIILTASIVLNSLKIFNLIEIVPIAIALILLEFFFQSEKKDILNQ